ncbi:hypothetical protein [Actinokineospora sp.]|uniref:hypothetical protein n=1 Tax=Actinokineospora sp. TaxID=1872133 RepID=UPI004037CD28
MGTERSSGEVAAEYGVLDYGQAPTVAELREQIMAEGRARYGPFLGPLMGMLNSLSQTDDKLDAQAQDLRQGTVTRTAPGAPGVHYQGIPHQQLYDAVHNGIDPDAVGSVGESWIKVGNKLAGIGDLVTKAIGSSATTWTGVAAEGARQALAGLANKSGQAGRASQLAGTVYTQQAQALATAKNTVPPPPNPPYDPRAAALRLQTITDPVAYAQQAQLDQQQAAAQQAAHRQAAQAVQTYDQTLTATASAAPAFAPPPRAAKPDDGRDAVGTDWRGGAPGDRTDTPTGGHGGSDVPPGGPGAPGDGSGPAGGHGGAGSTEPAGQTSGSGATPVTSVTGGVGIGPGGQPVAGARPESLPIGPGGVGSGTGDTGRGGLGGGLPGRSTGGGPGSSGPPGSGGRAGASPLGGASAGESAAGRGTGRPGTSGVGAGMGAGGRGSRAEDTEHQRPDYLVEADPDGLFGTDEITAPPVIGL